MFLVSLFVFGTVWFWISLLFISCMISYLLEGCEGSKSGWNRILITAAIFTYSLANWQYWKNGVNWYTVGIFAVSYIAIGVIWSFFKWWRFIVDRKEQYDKTVEEYDSIKETILNQFNAKLVN